MKDYLRGDMYYADLGRGIGSEQKGYRPVLIIQNNVGNKHSPVFLAGDSLKGIAKLLEEKGIKSPTGKAEWQFSTIQSILSNERYKGDAIINKTYITDCISKKVRVNNGERPKYYVENSHPAIIDSSTFGRVQEELARRSGKRKISRKAKTEQGKYSSKYALTELLVCGECKSAYRNIQRRS